MGKVKFYHADMRETVLDVSGQEIMTSDKVTLRMNSAITYRVVDALKSVSVVNDSQQAVYREAQLALRAVVGTFVIAGNSRLNVVLAEKGLADRVVNLL